MKYYTLVKVKTPAETEEDTRKTKKSSKTIKIYKQKVLWIPSVSDKTECIPMFINLKPDVEPLPEGFYCLVSPIQVSRFGGRLEIPPFDKIKLCPIDEPQTHDEMIQEADKRNHHRSVLERPDFGEDEPEMGQFGDLANLTGALEILGRLNKQKQA
ncbi:MAG: hypothetical protein SVR94_00445 [Pseudomonadota bacterium]|nr:hypothetical protein [Pseudomonadota bacterium]